VGIVAQRAKLGLDEETAYRRAWETITEVNPFPAALGRICPHPCEAGCNRTDKDGPVAINALEQFLGDWAIDRSLPLPVDERVDRAESVGVVGAGPSGLSFAYQMARRGYAVTVYDQHARAGGMLRYGVPDYRLPPSVLDAEIARILQLGVELRLDTKVGKDVTLDELRARHDLIYVGIGAQRSRALDIPGEEGPGVWSGIDFLGRYNRGERVDLGAAVVVVGGGNTAVDAARTARRTGADVTMLYRRTRAEMPAEDREIDEALDEGVSVEYLVAPVEVRRSAGRLRALLVRRMELGEPDASGRRRPRPIPGSEFEIAADAVVAAVAQRPDWDGFGGGEVPGPGSQDLGLVELESDLWTGGDATGPGIAGMAIAHGRNAAEIAHARLRGLAEPVPDEELPIRSDRVKLDFYPEAPRATRGRVPAELALADPGMEVGLGLSEADFLDEVTRCFSCGLCFGCQHCFMYCTAPSFTALPAVGPGAYFSLSLDVCRDCGKCVDVCPCGYLEIVAAP
jgi:formate dehydrogenase major subunit